MAFVHRGCLCAFSECLNGQRPFCIIGTGMVFHQYGFSCAFLTEKAVQTISHIIDMHVIFFVSLQYGLSCASLGWNLTQMTFHIFHICMVLLQYEFSCAHLDEYCHRTFFRIRGTGKFFLLCGFLCELLDEMSVQTIYNIIHMCMVYHQYAI